MLPGYTGRRDADGYSCSDVGYTLKIQGTAAHHPEPVLNILQTDMKIGSVLVQIKTRSVVVHRDYRPPILRTGRNGNLNRRPRSLAEAVFNGILDKGLQRQCREAESGVFRVKTTESLSPYRIASTAR